MKHRTVSQAVAIGGSALVWSLCAQATPLALQPSSQPSPLAALSLSDKLTVLARNHRAERRHMRKARSHRKARRHHNARRHNAQRHRANRQFSRGGARHHNRHYGHHNRRYYDNDSRYLWSVLPFAAGIIAGSNNNTYRGRYYACQARYRGHIYRGSFRSGGPCYIKVRGVLRARHNYQPIYR